MNEYSACEVRKILQHLFPQRQLVLSQLTFFAHSGVSEATGSTFRRGRRCYRLEDMLSIGCVLSLKENGIPLKAISELPALIRSLASRIMQLEDRCYVSGWGENVLLHFESEIKSPPPLELFLNSEQQLGIFWSLDLTDFARSLIVASTEAFLVQDNSVGVVDPTEQERAPVMMPLAA
jgi:hypothetical protein